MTRPTLKQLLPWTLIGTLPLWQTGKTEAAGKYYLNGRNSRAKVLLTVNNLLDEGPGSLRDAIEQANANPGLDEIRFDVEGLLPVGMPLAITDDLHIIGPGSGLLELEGGNFDRVFDVFDPEALVFGGEPEVFEARISGLTISNGQAPFYDYNDTRYFYDAGGLLALEVDLTLEDVTFRNNYGAVGGAVYFRSDLVGDLPQPPTLTLRDCVFEDNIAIAGGGGVMVADTGRPGVIERSRFSGNLSLIGMPESTRQRRRGRAEDLTTATAVPQPAGLIGLLPGGGGFSNGDLDHEIAVIDSSFNDNAGYLGGAIRSSVADGGGLRIERSTMSDNIAAIGGGIGSFYLAETSQMHVFNSTISGNAAQLGSGFGAVFVYPGSNERKLIFDHTTIVDNRTYQQPGTVFLYDARLNVATPIVLFDNTVIGSNLHVAGGGRGIEPATVDLNLGIDVAIEARFSAFESFGTADLIDVGTGNSFGTVGKFSPLVRNDGLTEVHLPLAGSPLINSADPASVRFSVDQRGLSRLAGGRSDIGAVEVDALNGTPDLDSDPASGSTIRLRALEGEQTERSMRISNYGGAALQFDVPALVSPFSADAAGPYVLLPGESLEFTLTCAPISNGLFIADWVFTNNDLDEDPLAFALECGAVGSALPIPVLSDRTWQVLAAVLLALAGLRFGAFRRHLERPD